MFTGLIKEIGKVIHIENVKEGKLFQIEAIKLIHEMDIDDSVSVNGACQTVVAKNKTCFQVQSVPITLQKTTLSQLKIGSQVNLELAMKLSDRLGGHLVSGHVNEVGKIAHISKKGDNAVLTVRCTQQNARYLVDEGSVCLEGISLTVAKVLRPGEFQVSIIPHTLANTTLGQKRVGDTLNVEFDLIAKYLENLHFFKNKSTSVEIV